MRHAMWDMEHVFSEAMKLDLDRQRELFRTYAIVLLRTWNVPLSVGIPTIEGMFYDWQERQLVGKNIYTKTTKPASIVL